MTALAPATLLTDLRTLIEAARQRTASTVNQHLVLLYWQVGHRIHTELLDETRAPYGQQIVSTLSRELVAAYGRGFSRPNLHRMVQLATTWPDREIVSTLSRQLTWSHFSELLLVKEPLARDFYAEMCRVERWSVRTLRDRVRSMLYERTALSKKPDKLIEQELATLRDTGRMTPDLVFRDPYLLDFLGLADTYSERDFEAAILRELEAFILELGSDFAFVARQRRITIGGDDFWIDLLFYHRGLRRLVLIELKLGRFEPAHKGQVELYLRWLAKHEHREGEETPLGLILCAGKEQQVVELLELEGAGIHVAEYLTALPPRELLQARLQAAVERARTRPGLPSGAPTTDATDANAEEPA